MRCLKQRGDFIIGESGDAAAYTSDEEWTLKMVRTMIEKLKKQGWT